MSKHKPNHKVTIKFGQGEEEINLHVKETLN